MRASYPLDDRSLGEFLKDVSHASPEDTKNFALNALSRLDFIQNLFRSNANFNEKKALLEASLSFLKNKIKQTGDLETSKEEIEAIYKVANALIHAHISEQSRADIYLKIKEFDNFIKDSHFVIQKEEEAENPDLVHINNIFLISPGSYAPTLTLLDLFEMTRTQASAPLQNIMKTYMNRVYAACPKLKEQEYLPAVTITALLLAIKNDKPDFKNTTFFSLLHPNSEITLQQLNDMEVAFLKLIRFETKCTED